MRIKDLMSLSKVPRWGIMETTKRQNVAEHSFNVAVLSIELAERVGWHKDSLGAALRWALHHDGPEVYTGDIPTPTKRKLGKALDEAEFAMCPWYVDEHRMVVGSGDEQLVKTADILDGLIFLKRYALNNTQAVHVNNELMGRLRVITDEGPLFNAAETLLLILDH